jgi:hypothetical protein
VGQRHRGQRLAFGPEQRQGQPAQRREHRRAGQQHRHQPQHEGQQRQAGAVEMPREQKAGGGEAAPVSAPTQARPAPRAPRRTARIAKPTGISACTAHTGRP